MSTRSAALILAVLLGGCAARLPPRAIPGVSTAHARAPASMEPGARIETLLRAMSLREKIALIHGAPEPARTDQGEAGYLPGLARLGIPSLRFADGPPGVLTRHAATGLTATMGFAATFSRADAEANGAVIGRDAKALGIDVVLEPYLNIERDPAFARVYNTYGEDPLLTGRIGAGLIRGIQSQGVMAMAKHFIGYEGAGNVAIGPQALHEIYLAPFAAAVHAGVAAIMCSYNLINGHYACGNRALLTRVLREGLHFRGFVTSDWSATHSARFLGDGLDLEMPGGGTTLPSYFQALPPPRGAARLLLGPPLFNLMPEEPATPAPPPAKRPASHTPRGLLAALRAGAVSAADVDRAAADVLGQMQRFGLLDGRRHRLRPGPLSASIVAADEAVVRRTAEDAAVLLKDDGDALPLSAQDLGSLALIGPGALQTIAVGVSGEKALGLLAQQGGPAEVLVRRAHRAARVTVAAADDMTGTPIPARFLSHAGASGLLRESLAGQVLGHDAQLDFTVRDGGALAPGTRQQWRGRLDIPRAGRYGLYLQVLGARAALWIDGRRIARTGPLQRHGNVVQPGQDSLLPSIDGLDNVRKRLSLAAGPHAIELRVQGEGNGQPVQVRLNWMTPRRRRAEFRRALAAARVARKAVVFAWSRGDPYLHLPGEQDRLIEAVAAANPNTVVVLNVSGPIEMPWLSRVKAVLLMWYPGDQGGWATADVLLGRASPAGRLPFTWPRGLRQELAHDPAHPERSAAGLSGRTTYSEGIFVGYRWFDHEHLEPLYPFGYGLSYTHFVYSHLRVMHPRHGGLDVRFRLRNAGGRAGDEVAQLYLGPPPRSSVPARVQFAPRALAAFARVHLGPGRSRIVQLHVAHRALQYWSPTRGAWETAEGMRQLFVGASSRDVRLSARIGIRGRPAQRSERAARAR